MKLFVNDTEINTQATTITELLLEHSQPETSNIAVAINGEIVLKHIWGECQLKDSDRVEVFTAIAGG